MKNFLFYNPTRVYFGNNCINEGLNKELEGYRKTLLTYGGGSIKKNGVYDSVLREIRKYNVVEFPGIEPNPSYETLMKAIEIAREEKIDFILAVGGGSVIDGTKFISASINYQKDPWEILSEQKEVYNAVPFGCVLTIPAAGSEMNCGAVISKKSTNEKLAFGSPSLFPKFSILDPVYTYSLPDKQIALGIIDAYIHVTEQYLTYQCNSPLQNRFAEGILLTLIEESTKVFDNRNDYETRSNIMFCAMMALNGIISLGVPEDWSTHRIGHEITALFGLYHAETLAIVFFGVMQEKMEQKKEKLLQYSNRIFNTENIEIALDKTRELFERIGIKTHLSDYGIRGNDIDRILENLQKHGFTGLGERGDIDIYSSRRILEYCL